jgi:hypothetical protein
MRKRLLIAALAAAALSLPALSQAARVGVDINIGPPAAVVEAPPPPPPQPGYIWTAGYWSWDGVRYVWVPGSYIVARPGWRWVPPHYVAHGPYYRFVPGHWRR